MAKTYRAIRQDKFRPVRKQKKKNLKHLIRQDREIWDMANETRMRDR